MSPFKGLGWVVRLSNKTKIKAGQVANEKRNLYEKEKIDIESKKRKDEGTGQHTHIPS